jgi:hypothetical protein
MDDHDNELRGVERQAIDFWADIDIGYRNTDKRRRLCHTS